jgi:hypothetical protein
MPQVQAHDGRPGGTNARLGFFRHAVIILAVLTITVALYHQVTKSYFCSDDDFLEVHRAAFIDAPNPSVVFTTTHFNSFKYRPLNRWLNLVTYQLGGGRPEAFRSRNLFCHLINIALVYFLAIVLRKSAVVAGAASLLFALHPLANQAVIGAVMTNTAANSMYLLAIVLCVLATRTQKREVLYVMLAGICGIASLFTYDTNVVVFGAMLAYFLMLHMFLGRPVSKRSIITLSVVVLCSLALYLGARQLFAASAYQAATKAVANPAQALHNVFTYVGALLQVFDPVLLNQWFKAPLPSDPTFFSGVHELALIAITSTVAIAIGALAALLMRSPRPAESWVADGFLMVAGWLPILPVLLLARHPSETYLYPTVAFMSIVLVSLFYDFYRTRSNAAGRLLLLGGILTALIFGLATWVRNQRVSACGITADKILAAVPVKELRAGATVTFVDASSEIEIPYGYYRFHGLNAVGAQSRTLQCAVQLVSGNANVCARKLDVGELEHMESEHQSPPGDVLVLIESDGNVTQQKIAQQKIASY